MRAKGLVAIVLTCHSACTTAALANEACAFEWKPGEGVSGLWPSVNTMTVWDDGFGPALYLDAHLAGDVPADGIVRWDGTTFTPVSVPSDTTFLQLTEFNGQLTALVKQKTAPVTSANRVLQWDGLQWSQYGTDIEAFSCNALAVYDNAVVVSRSVLGGGQASFDDVVTWDGVEWMRLGDVFDRGVATMTVYDGQLIAGGGFKQIGEEERKAIARWDGSSWLPLDDGFQQIEQPFPLVFGAVVVALHIHQDQLIAAGRFDLAGDTAVNNIASWDGTEWSALGSGLPLEDSFTEDVATLASFQGKLIAGGDFATVGGNEVNNIVAWDGTHWTAMQNGVDSELGGSVRALGEFQGALCVGGNFKIAGSVGVLNLARWDGTEWFRLADGMNGQRVLAMQVYEDELVLAGDFTTAGGLTAWHIAKWNGSSWSTLGDGITPRDTGIVNSMANYDGKLIAGGWFNTAGHVSASNIAQWDGDAWSAMGGGTDFGVDALVPHGDSLIVGGRFTQAGGAPANYVARWNGSSWSPMGAGLDHFVSALIVHQDQLFAAVRMYDAGNNSSRIARWNGASWEVAGEVLNGRINVFMTFEGALLAGGNFTRAGNTEAQAIAEWNGQQWLTYIPGFSHLGNSTTSMAIYNGDLILAGQLIRAADFVRPLNNVVRWDGTHFEPLAGGVDSRTNGQEAMAVYRGELFVGGFLQTQDVLSGFWLRYSPVGGTTGDSDNDGIVDECDYSPGTLPKLHVSM